MTATAIAMTTPPQVPHEPVLLDAVVELLRPRPGALLVDGTLGAGGHAEALLERGADVIGIDRDPEARHLAAGRLARFGSRVRIVAGRHEDLTDLLDDLGIDRIDGLLLDLGVSSMQLDRPERGFALRTDGPLDMRMEPTAGEPASTLVNQLPESELADLIYRWGEERGSRRIARAICEARRQQPIETTFQLAAIVERATPPARRPRRIHAATRTFQALRVACNREIVDLQAAVDAGLERLRSGGRAVVIAYHSLEDRPIKQLFRERTGRADNIPRGLPIRDTDTAPFVAVTRRALRPDDDEVARNPRSRSARLRAVERR